MSSWLKDIIIGIKSETNNSVINEATIKLKISKSWNLEYPDLLLTDDDLNYFCRMVGDGLSSQDLDKFILSRQQGHVSRFEPKFSKLCEEFNDGICQSKAQEYKNLDYLISLCRRIQQFRKLLDGHDFKRIKQEINANDVNDVKHDIISSQVNPNPNPNHTSILNGLINQQLKSINKRPTSFDDINEPLRQPPPKKPRGEKRSVKFVDNVLNKDANADADADANTDTDEFNKSSDSKDDNKLSNKSNVTSNVNTSNVNDKPKRRTKRQKVEEKFDWMNYQGKRLHYKGGKIHARDNCAGCKVGMGPGYLSEVYILPSPDNLKKACAFCFKKESKTKTTKTSIKKVITTGESTTTVEINKTSSTCSQT